tara:strand:- start:7381 stop:8841 length:1461 start_codon:yes stop_codon:yes gene_type:complete
MRHRILAFALVAALPHAAMAFDSGSTGSDGAFNPTVNTVLDLPEDGIFNFTTVNIPSGVTVSFNRNTTNTPVVILASGDVTVAGAITVNGGRSADVGAAGDGNIGDDGLPGLGGPGGFDGGRGGEVGRTDAGNGLGPGGGSGSKTPPFEGCSSTAYRYGGGGGGFRGNGGTSTWSGCAIQGGVSYGTSLLLPLIGGSGGGAGVAAAAFSGSGGGGGGGALLLASSGTVTVTGAIRADGGAGGSSVGSGSGTAGGGGSGGAIRIVADTITGNGAISAAGGSAGVMNNLGYSIRAAGNGSSGRIRFEANTYTRTAASNPVHTFGEPGPVFVAGMPSLAIASVGGVAAPASPTGNADITLPADTQNPLEVVFQTSGVPVGNIVELTVTPAFGEPVTVVTPALSGSTESATASATVTLPVGPSTLQARTTYTVIAAVGDMLGEMYASGERVERIELTSALGGSSSARLITVSGAVFDAPIEALRIAAAGT